MLGDRLAAGQQTLDLLTEVRILVPQPKNFSYGRSDLTWDKAKFWWPGKQRQ